MSINPSIQIQLAEIPKYYCETCNYGSSKKCNYDSHLLSAKHNKSIIDKSAHHCKLCSKTYKDNSGLWRHNKKMHPKNANIIMDITSNSRSKRTDANDFPGGYPSFFR